MEFICKTCRKPKANFVCGICEEHVCKSCVNFLEEATFSFLKKIPKELTFTNYCNQCFDEKVSGPLSEHEATMEKAREVMIFMKNQTKKTGHIKRKELPLLVEDCEDEQETIMRLAYWAAKDGFNCLLDINITTKKIIVGSHKKTIFNGTAIPVTIDPKEIREY